MLPPMMWPLLAASMGVSIMVYTLGPYNHVFISDEDMDALIAEFEAGK